MKNISKTSAVLISLALNLTSLPLPAFPAAVVQTQVAGSAVPGGLTGLPVNAGSQNIGNGSLLTPSGRLNLGGSLALPQSPIVAAPGVTAVQGFAAPEAGAPAAPVVLSAQGPAASVLAAPAQGPQAQLSVLAEEASAETAAVPAGRKSLVGRLASAIASKLSFGRVFDNSKPAAPGAVAGILPQKSNLPQGMVLDEAPTTPPTKGGGGVSIENFDLPGALTTGPDIFSGPTLLNADPANEADVERALRAMVDADPAKFGIPSAQLATVHVRRVAGVGHQADTIYAYFQQQQNGVVMHGTGLSFTVKVLQNRPVVMATMAKLYPNTPVDTTPRFPDEELKDKALERLGPYVQMFGLEASFLEKKIVYVKGAWHAANIYLIENGPGPIMLAVDVVTGEAFAWNPRAGADEAAKKDVVAGAVSGKTVDKGPQVPGAELKDIPLAYLSVKIGGKTYVTDKDGRFTTDSPLQVGPEGLALAATLSGPFVNLQDSSGKTLSVNVAVKPGDTGLQVVFNPNSTLNDENALAQISAFQKVNLAYGFLKDHKVTNEKMDSKPIVVRTNIDDECNAYYTPGRPSLNFFKSSENCVNSGYDTVADHEYGHYWDDMLGGIVNGGLSEGWGDIVSMYLLNNPIIGEHFLKKARPDADGNLVDYIRHGDNKYQYNDYDEVHDQGQAWGGFAWKLRKGLMAKLGDAAGAALAESLVLPTMFAKASNIPAAMAQVLLSDMDAQGNLPHEADIRAAAKAHGIALPQNPSMIVTLARRLTNWLLGRTVSYKGAEMGGAAEGRMGFQADQAEQPQVRAKMTFTVGALLRGRVKRELSRFLDQQDGITYELKEYKGWVESDFLLVINGPQDKVQRVTDAIQSWFRSLESN
ncbi:MAG: hypothetical protein HY926_14365 [Elusimicrobia bacterium]|nr:hypothetical protein [Elusimicrobiota bacterium]